ncbi:hypothetical protein [Streptomyces sp. NPDC000618]|uniref:hypothetical protein n=1 Tax=Streptomyces sp. NPDC000618 TaxID=3154265 RepID=UPI00331A4E92
MIEDVLPADVMPAEAFDDDADIHHRAPQWPVGVVGSMTHCSGYRAAAVVARADRLHSVGSDAEESAPLPGDLLDLLDLVVLPTERDLVERLGAQSDAVPWDRSLFSCQDAVHKAWFPSLFPCP